MLLIGRRFHAVELLPEVTHRRYLTESSLVSVQEMSWIASDLLSSSRWTRPARSFGTRRRDHSYVSHSANSACNKRLSIRRD